MYVTPPGGTSPTGEPSPSYDQEAMDIYNAIYTNNHTPNPPPWAGPRPPDQEPSIGWYLEQQIYGRGLENGPFKDEEAYINSVLACTDPDGAGKGDAFMRFNISDHTWLDGGQGSGSLIEQMGYFTSGYPDKWLPTIPSWADADTWYFTVKDYPNLPSELQPLQADLEKELITLQSQASPSSPVTHAQFEQALAAMIFNKDFFTNYPGITASNAGDLFAFLDTVGFPMSTFTQRTFTDMFLGNETWLTETGPGAKLTTDYISELQKLWTSGGDVNDLQTWFENTTYKSGHSGQDFFANYPGISSQDFENLRVNCLYSAPDINVMHSYFNVGQWLQNHPSDPGQGLFTAFYNKIIATWPAGHFSDLQSWLYENDQDAKGIFDYSFYNDYGAVTLQDIKDLLGCASDPKNHPIPPDDFISAYLGCVATGWLQGLIDPHPAEYGLAYQVVDQMRSGWINYWQSPTGDPLNTLQSDLENSLAVWVAFIPSHGNISASELLDVLNHVNITPPEPNFLSEYLWAGNKWADKNTDQPTKNLLLLMLNDLEGYWKPPMGTLTGLQKDSITWLTNPADVSGLTATDLQDFVQLGLGETRPDAAFAQAYLNVANFVISNPNDKMGADMWAYASQNLTTGTVANLQTWITNEIFVNYDYKNNPAPLVSTVTALMSYVSQSPPSYYSNITHIMAYLANPGPLGALGNLISNLRDHLKSLWPDSSGSWNSIQSWVQGYPGGQIFDPNFFTTYSGLTKADFGVYLANFVALPALPPMADNYYDAGTWLANASTDAPGQALAKFLITNIETNWTSWQPNDLAAHVKARVLATDFFTGDDKGMTLDDFNNFMAIGGYTPSDTNLSTAYFNFGTYLAKGDADASFYQAFRDQANTLLGNNSTYTALQDFGQGYINAAFLDTNNNPPNYSEAAVNNMEAWLNVGSTGHFTKPDQGLQDALFQVYAFMKGKASTTGDYQLGLKMVQFAFLGQQAPSDWPAKSWPTGNTITLQTFMNTWFNPPAGSNVIDDPYLMYPGAVTADVVGLFTNLGLGVTYSTPSVIDQECQTAWAYLQKLGGNDAKLFNDFIGAYQAAGSQQIKGSSPDYTSLIAWANNILMNDFSNYPNLLPTTKTEFYNEVGVWDSGAVMFQDRNYVQDTWLTDPAHQGQFFQQFGKNLTVKMTDYLIQKQPLLTFQQYLSSFFFVDIPDRFPDMQFSDVTSLLGNFKSFQSYPNFNALATTYTDRNSYDPNKYPGTYALFDTLAGKIFDRRNDADLKTVVIWMNDVIFSGKPWSDNSSPPIDYTWPDGLTADQQAAFKAIGGIQSEHPGFW